AARPRLRNRRMEMLEDDLPHRAPSHDPRFADRVRAALRDFHAPNPDHDVSKMPWSRLYADLEERASSRPGGAVPGDQRAVFNALLKETQAMFPDDPVLQTIPEARGEETAEELLVSVGQGNHA